MALKPLIDRSQAACLAALEEIGFKRKYRISRLDINDEVFGSVGLPRVAHHATRTVEIYPTVWVSHVPLETKVAEIRGGEAPKHYRAHGAIVQQLGYLTPRRRFTPWWFSEDSDVEALAREMADSVAKYALPFYREHATLKALYDSMRERKYGGITQEHAYRVPVAAMMLGLPDAAKSHIAGYLVKLGAQSESQRAERLPIPKDLGVGFLVARTAKPGIVSEYREFAEALLKLMAEARPK